MTELSPDERETLLNEIDRLRIVRTEVLTKLVEMARECDAVCAERNALQRQVAELTKGRDKALAFKAWVHKWLDDHGVPISPDPAKTASTGCRIGPRMEWLWKRTPGVEAANILPEVVLLLQSIDSLLGHAAYPMMTAGDWLPLHQRIKEMARRLDWMPKER